MNETVVNGFIIGYCIFQAVGIFFVGRAVFRMWRDSKQQPQVIRQKRASND